LTRSTSLTSAAPSAASRTWTTVSRWGLYFLTLSVHCNTLGCTTDVTAALWAS
jgi:hypothetical protein